MTLSRLLRAGFATVFIAAVACFPTEPEDPEVTEPNVPATFNGRPVYVQGTAYFSNQNVTLRLWDSGTVDGDVVSVAVNGVWVVQNYTLTGTKKDYTVTLNRGYSYILLYAHNEGSISPNTAAVAIDDGTGEQVLVLSADLSTNGAYNLVVSK